MPDCASCNHCIMLFIIMHGNVCGNLSRKSSAQPALPDSQPRTTPSLTFAALAIFSTDIPMAERETAISWRQNFPQPGRMGQLRQRIHRRPGDVIEINNLGIWHRVSESSSERAKRNALTKAERLKKQNFMLIWIVASFDRAGKQKFIFIPASVLSKVTVSASAEP